MLKSNPQLVEYATYVDNDGNIVVPVDKGYATVKYTYGAFRVTVKEEYLDENGELVNGVDGYAFIKRKYRDRKLLEAGYYDVNGNLVTGPDGYARQELQYGGNHLISTWCYDPEGNPAGTHRILEYKKHNKAFLVTSDSWYDTEGQLARGPNGYAKVKRTYDTYGKVIIDSYYDENDQPMMVELLGYARVKNIYLSNHLVRTEYYDTKQKPVRSATGIAVIKYQIENKMTVSEAYYDTDGVTLVNNPEGYARIDYANDGKQMISEKLFTADGEPFYDGDLFNEVRYTWQDKKKASVSYWKDGTEANGHDGYHEVLFEYNNAG